MRVTKEQKLKIRASILDAASRGFRENGFGGLGIDGLAKNAGLTSGAFYGHFASKQEAFNRVIETGMNSCAESLENIIKEHGENWPHAFIEFYLGHDHVDDLGHSCVIPGLSADVMRANEDTKSLYEESVLKLAEKMAGNLSEYHNRKRTDTEITSDTQSPGPKAPSSQEAHALNENVWPIMAMMAGSVMMARCVNDPQLKADMLSSSKKWVVQMMDSST